MLDTNHMLTLITIVFIALVIYFTIQDIIKVVSINLFNYFNTRAIETTKKYYIEKLKVDSEMIRNNIPYKDASNERTPVDMMPDVKCSLNTSEYSAHDPKLRGK